jgi:uncharacterized protein (TIGR03066 family)
MTMLRTVLTAFAVAIFGSAALAADDNKKLIVGKWEVTKADEGTLPVGSIVEFVDGGKMRVTAKKGGQDEEIDGTYTLSGDELTVMHKRDGEERTVKIAIKKLSKTELMVEGPEGKSLTLKRK